MARAFFRYPVAYFILASRTMHRYIGLPLAQNLMQTSLGGEFETVSRLTQKTVIYAISIMRNPGDSRLASPRDAVPCALRQRWVNLGLHFFPTPIRNFPKHGHRTNI